MQAWARNIKGLGSLGTGEAIPRRLNVPGQSGVGLDRRSQSGGRSSAAHQWNSRERQFTVVTWLLGTMAKHDVSGI